jgi:cell division protease FtsH
VVVAAALGRAGQLQRVSILSRGPGAASTTLIRQGDEVLFTREDLLQRLDILMAGAAAEELAFGDRSTGSEKDLELATATAIDLTCRYGMSEVLGWARLAMPDRDAFLGGETSLDGVSPETRSTVEAEVRALLAQAHANATLLITQHRGLLDHLADRLGREETLEAADLQALSMDPVAAAPRSRRSRPTT